MHWLADLWNGAGTAHLLFAFSLAAAAGLALGRLRLKGIGLGVAGVLFAGLILSWAGLDADGPVLDFVREFGLILFIFSIGLQLGPGFFTSLRSEGMKLNLLAVLNVATGLAVCGTFLFFSLAPAPVALGLLSGATTNTPSLAAAQQVFAASGDAVKLQGMSYALAYPFGIAGIIITMLLLRHFSPRGGIPAETKQPRPKVGVLNLCIVNPALEGHPLSTAFRQCRGVTFSRIGRDGTVRVPSPDEILKNGDVLLAVGELSALEQARLLAGGVSTTDLRMIGGPILNKRAIVTHTEVLGKTLAALSIRQKHCVAATRLVRHGVEIVPDAATRLQFGDVVTLVGTEKEIAEVAGMFGDSMKELEHTRVGPLFFGISLGVILGMLPIALPGLPAPVKFGLAGGPLIVALFLGRLGTLGRIVWYVPNNAALALREIGITLFLAAVGLKSGSEFFTYLLSLQGLQWMAMGAAITILPLLATAIVGRVFLRVPVPEMCGVLAGAMTDPPALAYAQQVHEGNATSLAYATVYPLTMLLRVMTVQCLALYLAV
jgi:putative transport protein